LASLMAAVSEHVSLQRTCVAANNKTLAWTGRQLEGSYTVL